MKHIATIAIMLTAGICTIQAQPQRRVQNTAQQQAQSPTSTLSVRAQTQYNVQSGTPTEVSWKRDIYRELDLRKEKNAALYYPEEPLGDRVNFFTLILNLILDGKISAYEYRLDGNELFSEDNKLDVKQMLDRHYIYWEEKNGRITVPQTDIPSNEVLKYFIKESNYLDQRTSDFITRVTAICPVLVRDGLSYPMFWLDYTDLSPYLSQTQVMTSSYNNTQNMSLNDYFVLQHYQGDIYKTSNLRNQPLQDYCDNDSALMNQERQKIEQQLSDFQSHLWNSNFGGTEEPAAEKKTAEKKEKTTTVTRNTQPRQRVEKAPKQSKSSGGSLSAHKR